MESPSPSSRTDDGRGDASRASLESGLGVIGVGDSPRSCAFGILPAGVSASQERSMDQRPGYRSVKRNIVQMEMTGSSSSSFLPIQHDGGVRPQSNVVCSAAANGRTDFVGAARRFFSLGAHCKQPARLRPQARTGHGPANYHEASPGSCRTAQGPIQECSVRTQSPRRREALCQAVDVTQQSLRVADCATQGRERDSTEGSRS